MPVVEWCWCNHQTNEHGQRVLNAGAYWDGPLLRCGHCNNVIPMTPTQKHDFQFAKEIEDEKRRILDMRLRT